MPGVVGVPERVPPLVRLRPGGRLAGTVVNVDAPTPPTAVMICGPYATFCVALGSVAGLTVIDVTVKAAFAVVTVPQEFVKTAWYCLPLSPLLVTKLSVVAVAPGRSLNGPPLETCHCTVEGLPEAAAV